MTTIRIDKDYCSEPLWVQQEAGENYFCNGYLPDFKEILSESLYADLEQYSVLWENTFWYLLHNEDNKIPYGKTFELLAKSLAIRCAEEVPDIKWCYWDSEQKTEIYVNA